MRPAMELTRKLIGLQWRERSSLSNIFELIDDGLDCLGLHCAFVKLQPVQRCMKDSAGKFCPDIMSPNVIASEQKETGDVWAETRVRAMSVAASDKYEPS